MGRRETRICAKNKPHSTFTKQTDFISSTKRGFSIAQLLWDTPRMGAEWWWETASLASTEDAWRSKSRGLPLFPKPLSVLHSSGQRGLSWSLYVSQRSWLDKDAGLRGFLTERSWSCPDVACSFQSYLILMCWLHGWAESSWEGEGKLAFCSKPPGRGVGKGRGGKETWTHEGNSTTHRPQCRPDSSEGQNGHSTPSAPRWGMPGTQACISTSMEIHLDESFLPKH